MKSSRTLIGVQHFGDQFSDVYETLRSDVEQYLLRRGADRSDVSDLVADVFTIAWTKREELPIGTHLKPWMLVTARFVLNNHIRKSARDDVLHACVPEIFVSESGPLSRLLAWEQERDVWIALGRLSADDRELLLLTAWDGLTPNEAAAALGVAAATVRVRLHRARKRFTKHLVHVQAHIHERPTVDHTIDLTDRERTQARQGTQS